MVFEVIKQLIRFTMVFSRSHDKITALQTPTSGWFIVNKKSLYLPFIGIWLAGSRVLYFVYSDVIFFPFPPIELIPYPPFFPFYKEYAQSFFKYY